VAGALSDGEEIFDVLASNKLFGSFGISNEEFLAELDGIVQLRVRLEHGDDGTPSEALFNTADVLASQVTQTDVHPALLMRDVLEADHTEDNLFIGHITNVVNDSPILLSREPRLAEVAVELLYDRVAVLREPSSSFLLRELEYAVVELLPQLDASSRDLVNGLTELRTNGEDAAGLLRVGAFPVLIINALGINDELLDGLGGMCLLRDHRPRTEEEAVERHGLNAEHTSGPPAREVRPGIFNTTEARSSE
jgi:hypothetical protein